MADSPETGSTGSVGVTVKIEGAQISDDILIASVRVRSGLNRIPEAQVTILSGSLQTDDFDELDAADFVAGKEIEIAAFYGDGADQTLFKGLIISSRARIDSNTGLRLELYCRDKAIGMTEIRKSVRYEEKKDSDVISDIIGDAGLTADVEATTDTAADKLRAGTTDWDYLRLLADRNGLVVNVIAGKVSVKAPDTSAAVSLEVTVGADVLELDIEIDSQRMIKSASATSWDDTTQETVSGTSATVTGLTPDNVTAANLAEVLSDREHTAFTAATVASAELTTRSKARTTRAGLGAVSGSVTYQGNNMIEPGKTLEIKGFGERYSGTGYAVSVEHRIEAGTWLTVCRLGLPPDWTSDSTGFASPAAEAMNAPIHGLQIGKVLTVAEDPDTRLRIQIELPLVGDPPAKVWARYAQPYASSAAGIQFLPETGDEVVVAFLNADPEAPVIVGSLHNGTAARPIDAEEDNNLKTITTRSELRMTFDDDKKIITVSTPGGHTLTLDDDASTFSMEDMNGNSIVMDDSGIAITSDKDISITATQNITAEATQDATIEGMNITCTAQTELTVEGNATAKLSSGGQTTVEGSIVMIN
ncbi:type VI secretion system tip protein VgrG [uncultured Roseobacter sp.]|uniref:type VI secretion system tip protein VgrG n=1 Tax=uncultured Roseobacter sp. TaxID=114847 RepID=UPI002623C885|nr:type VI secretion system tip protein VgrG [uncultured Roseobacter sp.]